jgi:hypothetical protein
LIGLLGYIDAVAKLGGCIVGLLSMDSTVDNPESRKKNGATEEGAIFTPRSVRLYKGMLIASIDCFLKLNLTPVNVVLPSQAIHHCNEQQSQDAQFWTSLIEYCPMAALPLSEGSLHQPEAHGSISFWEPSTAHR